jgi:hypothetical protein
MWFRLSGSFARPAMRRPDDRSEVIGRRLGNIRPSKPFGAFLLNIGR